MRILLTLTPLFLICAALVVGNESANQPAIREIEIRGIYGSPEPFWKKNIRLDKLGVNAIFVHDGSITETMIKRARAEGAKVFAEFATLNGKQYVKDHPVAWAIDKNGNKVEQAAWFMGVCPTEPSFKQYRLTELKSLLRKFELDGIWMDYLHWHAQFEDPKPIVPETCFCEHCLAAFQSSTGIKLPEGDAFKKAETILNNHDNAWRSWRCSVIADWVRDFRKVINQERPGALLGVYHCPWDDDDFNGARRRTLGLDYDTLRNIVDVFSPMVYHGRMGKSPEWVQKNITWFCDRLKINEGSFPKVWPIVQASNEPKAVSPEEFENVLEYGAGAKASGVMMFTSFAVAEDESKINILRKVYTRWAAKK